MGGLIDPLSRGYDVLGLGAAAGDEVFFQLVLARIIEPVSKLDSLRVLEEAGRAPVSYPTINRRLPVYARGSWRQRLPAACAAHAGYTEHGAGCAGYGLPCAIDANEAIWQEPTHTKGQQDGQTQHPCRDRHHDRGGSLIHPERHRRIRRRHNGFCFQPRHRAERRRSTFGLRDRDIQHP
jgi:hypothetical protein